MKFQLRALAVWGFVLLVCIGSAFAQTAAKDAPPVVIAKSQTELTPVAAKADEPAITPKEFGADWLHSDLDKGAAPTYWQVAMRIAGILLVLVVLAVSAKKLQGSKGHIGGSGERLAVLASAKLTGEAALHLVQAEGKHLLVGTTQGKLKLLTDLETKPARKTPEETSEAEVRARLLAELAAEASDSGVELRNHKPRRRNAPSQRQQDSMEDLLRQKIAALRSRSGVLS